MTDKTRRKFVSMMSAGAAVIPLTSLVGALPSHAQDDLPMVDPDSATGKALQYVAMSEVDGQMCSNCQLYTAGADPEKGACPLFQDAAVGGAAWCLSWVAA